MAKKSKYFEPLAAAVASGSSVKDAAELVGCSASVAYRITAEDEFRKRVSEIRTLITNQIVGRLSDASVEAVKVLRSLMNDEKEKGSVRTTAAKAILSSVGPAMDLHELRSRIDALEMSAAE